MGQHDPWYLDLWVFFFLSTVPNTLVMVGNYWQHKDAQIGKSGFWSSAYCKGAAVSTV